MIMCVIFFAYEQHPEFPLILLANRDEFYDRPTQVARFWEDNPEIFGGRDLIGGGTWLGVNKTGKFAAVTNYRDPNAPKGVLSRGILTADFLKTEESAEEYLKKIRQKAGGYSGFNLLLGEINARKNEIFYYSNRLAERVKLTRGIYGLSNHLLDTPWRKVENGKRFLAENLTKNWTNEDFFSILADVTLADDAELPDTGIGKSREKLLSAIFIRTPGYGTRCSTVLTFDKDFKSDFEERIFV